MKILFASVKILFASVKIIFASVKILFASVKIIFASLKILFASFGKPLCSIRNLCDICCPYAGAFLSADKSGYKINEGMCASGGCSGGSYASSGGYGYGVSAVGHSDVPYDSIFKPTAPGSAGRGRNRLLTSL